MRFCNSMIPRSYRYPLRDLAFVSSPNATDEDRLNYGDLRLNRRLMIAVAMLTSDLKD
jgi:hypothetical protein